MASLGKDMCNEIAKYLKFGDIIKLRQVNKDFYYHLNVKKKYVCLLTTWNYGESEGKPNYQEIFRNKLGIDEIDDKTCNKSYGYEYNGSIYVEIECINGIFKTLENHVLDKYVYSCDLREGKFTFLINNGYQYDKNEARVIFRTNDSYELEIESIDEESIDEESDHYLWKVSLYKHSEKDRTLVYTHDVEFTLFT